MSSEASRAVDPEFERFVRRSSRWLLRVGMLLAGDRGVAEDLLQLTLLRTARRWEAARNSPDGYARRVLVNLSRDRQRQARRRVVEHRLDPAAPLPVGRDELDHVLSRDAVTAALRELPRRQREVVVLRFYADLSVAETARAMDASEGTVKSYTARALARMRELLADPVPTTPAHRVEVSDHE